MDMSSIPQGAGLDLGYAADNMETLPYEPEGIQAESLCTIEMRMGSVTRNINIINEPINGVSSKVYDPSFLKIYRG